MTNSSGKKRNSGLGGRRETIETLRQSERKYRELVEHANSIILHWTRDGRITFLNEFGQRFFGYSEAEILGRHVIGTIVPETESTGRDLRPLMDQVCADPVAFERNVNENVRRNGERVWIAWTNKVYFDDQGQVEGILSIGTDITEQKRAASELQRVNRAMQTLSLCNQALVRAPDETSLLDEICRILVEQGGFCRAWIGFVEQDDGKSVRPVAAAGFEPGFLGAANVSWSAAARGRDPAGAAIGAEQFVIARNIPGDPAFDMWRESLGQRDCGSAMALPLTRGGRAFGALTVYAAGSDAFDADEAKLLSELADDLAYGIAALRTRVEHAQAEEALRGSQRQLSLILNNASDVIFAVGVEPNDGFRFAWVNRRFLEATGLLESQIVGARVRDVIPEPARTLVLAKYRDAIRSGLPGRWEEVSEYPAGRKIGHVTVVPVFDAHGICTQMVGMVHDITERKQAEDQVQSLNEELRRHAEVLEQRVAERTAELVVAKDRAESADRVKSAFLASMSHELRTPLNSIIGFTGITLQELAGPLTDEQRKQLGMVQDSARHLLNLINDVLDISKIEAGQLALSISTFELRPAIEKTAGLILPMAQKKGIALILEIADEVGTATSDQRRLEQVILNLLNNAVKFTERGHVRLACRTENGGHLVTVSDTGIGIPPEEFANIFEPFRQVDTGLARKHEGTGLGLSICKKLLDLMGGTISVESQLGRGSSFSVLFPKKAGDAR
jgi:PAS domain S-box-containing protein